GLPKIIVHQVWRNFDGFILLNSERFKGGLNARYLPPDWAVLDRITGVLFWLGLLVSFFRWRQTILWWTMLLVMLFPIQVFSTGTPDAARAVGAAPFFFLFAGLGIDWLLGLRLGRPLLLRSATVLLLIAIAYINISGYFHWMDQPIASAARQPAVEVEEFALWQELQMADAREGLWGFNVSQWHEMRKIYEQ
ncbi:MAG: hypothetical protein IIC81_09245, partial [Chloroflexi bacterium]|nr:hypothetical protein [Chloroflexota bacterium]